MFKSSKDAFKFSFLWSIDNITCSPLRPHEMMTSPYFTIDALGSTEWNLALFPRGINSDSKHMSVYLHRGYGRPDLANVAVSFKICLDCYDSRLVEPAFIKCVRFRENDYLGFPQFVSLDVSRHIASTSLTRVFTIRCEISPVETTDLPLDMVTLSEDLKMLYETRQLYDVVLRSGKTEMKAHRAVLWARSPEFFRQLKFDWEPSIAVADASFMSGRVLEMFVFYLYSGQLSVPVSETPRELLTVAEQFYLPDLARKMRTFPDVCSARTVLNVENKSIMWDAKVRLESDDSFIRIVPTPSMYFENVVISCKCVGESYASPVKKVDASFRLTGVSKEQPVFLKCKVLASMNDDLFLDLFNGHRIFDSSEEWSMTFPASTDDFVRFPCLTGLCFELEVCDGGFYSGMKDDWTPVSEGSRLYHDCTQLSSDLNQLRDDMTFADTLIVCGRSVFQTHKAVLAARSPVFEKMFQYDVIETQQGVVTVPDVRSDIMDLLLSYIYSGQVRDLTYETAAELYAAADKYAIIELRDKCSSFLLDVMRDENADGILLLADMHYDFNFKEKVARFIDRNEDDEVILEQMVPQLHTII